MVKQGKMKILVVSNNCFAQNNPNGRILGLLFKNIPQEDVAQFYIVNGHNDFDVCTNYYIVNDEMAIRSLYSKKEIGKIINKPQEETLKVENLSKYRAKYGRNSFTMLVRNFIWSRFCWWNAKFEKWIKDFNPDILLLQCGDAPFMYEIACRISGFMNIPLVEFNTEYSYFENSNFINKKDPNFIFKYYKRQLCTSFEKAMKRAKVSIYNSEWMKTNYDKKFNCPSEFIYQSSDYRTKRLGECHVNPHITYVGGLGNKRYEALIEIANAIYKLNPNWRLDVYGMIQNEETRTLFEQTRGLDYKGVVSYDEVKCVIADSDVLVLTENLDPEISKNTAYGFSTKITDYLFSEIPILAYGPTNNVGMNYLENNNAALVVHTRADLGRSIYKIITDDIFRNQVVETALALAHKNHVANANSEKFITILSKVLEN